MVAGTEGRAAWPDLRKPACGPLARRRTCWPDESDIG